MSSTIGRRLTVVEPSIFLKPRKPLTVAALVTLMFEPFLLQNLAKKLGTTPEWEASRRAVTFTVLA